MAGNPNLPSGIATELSSLGASGAGAAGAPSNSGSIREDPFSTL